MARRRLQEAMARTSARPRSGLLRGVGRQRCWLRSWPRSRHRARTAAMTVPRRPRLRTKLLLLGAGLLLALAAGELLVRLLPARGPLGSLFYQDARRREAAGIQEAAARGLVEQA